MPERLVVNQSNLEKATSNTSHASASTIAMAMKGAATDKMSAGAGGEGQQMFVKNPTGVKARVHDSETGQKLEDKYEIDKKKVLGTGFCGSVFQAKNKYTNEVVAVKILKKDEIGADESAESHAELMKRLLNECEIYMNADHPNINRLRDMYETDSCIYLVCDCCTGGELYDKLITRVQYKEVDAAKAMKGMLLAVSYIHNTMNIVHRDLKLQNWLYPSRKSSDEQLKLIDFGFSKIVKGGKMMSTTAGTVEYLAPELLSHTTQVQPAGDMWAMGIIVFMLLGGYPPFSGKDNQEIIHAIRKNNIKWFKSRFENVSTQGKNMIFGLLERKPEKRLTALQALAHP